MAGVLEGCIACTDNRQYGACAGLHTALRLRVRVVLPTVLADISQFFA